MAQQSIYLHVGQPGTLGELIGDFKYIISSIKLTGQLNGSDIVVLRDMCGHRQEWHPELNAYLDVDSEGILQNLDISGAHIVGGGEYVSVITYIDNTGYKNAGFYTENNIISEGMFTSLSTLRTIKLPNSAISINEGALQCCSNLVSVTIGKNVTEIGESVFYECESLRELIIKNPTPPTSRLIEEFENGEEDVLERMALDRILNGIDINKCQLTIPQGSREAYKESKIWRYFFDIRTVLETIFTNDELPADNVVCSLPGKLDRIIGTKRYNLENIKLSGYMDANDMAVLRDMMGIIVDSEGNVTHTDGRLSEIDMSEVEFISGSDCYYYVTDGGYAWRGAIEAELVLSSGAFAGCERLKSVILPSSIRVIGNNAFYGCSNMETCPIEDNIEGIDMNAFAECVSLKDVRLGQNLLTIGDGAFYNCPIDRVIIPDMVQIIGNRAFDSDTEIKELSIGNSVTQIGEQAFGKCDNLRELYVWATVPPSLGGKKSTYDDYYESDITFFHSIDFENCQLIVPDGTSVAYSSAPIWSRFKNIKESTTTGIDVLNINENDKDVIPKEIYDISGKRLEKLMPGLNIVRLNNGEVKKVMVK